MAEVKEENSEKPEKRPKMRKLEEDDNKAGIIYLSKIPPYMTVKRLRQMMEEFGEVGRIFLQPDEKISTEKKNRAFTEGWVEFKDKKLAKRVAWSLNNTQIGGKRKSKWYEELWNMKYLSRFKWTHLNERLAYEREVHKQRLRTEIMQAKKETNFFIQNVERHQELEKIEMKRQKKRKKEVGAEESTEATEKEKDSGISFKYKQKDTDEEIVSRKRKKKDEGIKDEKMKRTEAKDSSSTAGKKAADNKKFLMNLFSGGVSSRDTELS